MAPSATCPGTHRLQQARVAASQWVHDMHAANSKNHVTDSLGRRMSRWRSRSCAFRRAPHHQLVRQHPGHAHRHLSCFQCHRMAILIVLVITNQQPTEVSTVLLSCMQLVVQRRRSTVPSTHRRVSLLSCQERCCMTAAPPTGKLQLDRTRLARMDVPTFDALSYGLSADCL